MLLYCGLRPGETRALLWKHIDFAAHRISVESAVEVDTERIKGTKTVAGVREVPIPDVFYDDLVRAKGEPFAPVFTQESTGNRHTHSSINCLWQSFKKALDISMGAKYEKRKAKDGRMRMTQVLSVVAPDLTPYCLRHTYCTDLQNNGVPINIAKYLMDHATISVTANIYTHISDTAIDTAAVLINKKDLENGETHGEEFEISK